MIVANDCRSMSALERKLTGADTVLSNILLTINDARKYSYVSILLLPMKIECLMFHNTISQWIFQTAGSACVFTA
jgi:hypothetical protein